MKSSRLSVKLLCAFVSLILILGVSPVTANAAVSSVANGMTLSAKAVLNGEIDTLAFSDSVDVDGLTKYLKEQLTSFSTYISLSSYRIPKNTANVNALASLIFTQMPTVFHVSTFSYGPSYSSTIGYILPEYHYDADTYKAMMAEVDERAEEMVGDLKDNDALSDVQKTLLVHDRLANFCEYTLIEDTNAPEFLTTHSIYGAMVTGDAVCQGYAAAYTYMLDKLDIPSYICVSTALNHAWNIVYVNGNYYHVDVTFDDPLWGVTEWNVAGNVIHDYFLVSTEYMMANGHNATDYDTTPTDTSYDSYFWQNSNTAFQLVGDTVYYIDNSTGALNSYDGNCFVTIPDKWTASASSYWSGNLSCLATDGEVLFYSTPDAIYAYSPEKGRAYKAYEPDLSMGDYFHVYGMKYENGSFILDINNTPNFTNDLMQRVKAEYTFTVPVIEGDIDDDGNLSANDYILIKMYCNVQTEFSEDMAKKADVNCDGVITTADYIVIRMLLKQ